jgi:hypothetical protein
MSVDRGGFILRDTLHARFRGFQSTAHETLFIPVHQSICEQEAGTGQLIRAQRRHAYIRVLHLGKKLPEMEIIPKSQYFCRCLSDPT